MDDVVNDLESLKENGLRVDYEVTDEDVAVWARQVAEVLTRLVLPSPRPVPPRDPARIEFDGDGFWERVEARTRDRLGL